MKTSERSRKLKQNLEAKGMTPTERVIAGHNVYMQGYRYLYLPFHPALSAAALSEAGDRPCKAERAQGLEAQPAGRGSSPVSLSAAVDPWGVHPPFPPVALSSGSVAVRRARASWERNYTAGPVQLSIEGA